MTKSKAIRVCFFIIPNYNTSEVTHPLQKFEILLSTRPAILNNAWTGRHSGVDVGSLTHFRLTVLPEQMNLLRLGAENRFEVQIQLVLSAQNGPHPEYESCAVFAQIARLQVVLACDAVDSLHVFHASDLNHEQQSRHRRPWFYNPNFTSFEVTPSMLTDALRVHSVNESMRTSYRDIVNVTVYASVELRSFCDLSNTPASCMSHVLNAMSHTITHHSIDENRRSVFETNAEPDDLFDAGQFPAQDQKKPPMRLLSDFTCAGPNCRWPHADEGDFFNYGPNSRMNFSGYSMCLLRNVCFENQKMLMYMPHFFSNLEDFLDNRKRVDGG